MSRRTAWDPEEDAMPSFEPLRPSDALRERVLASALPASRFEGFVARFARLFDVPEARAREILAAANTVPSQGWVDTPLPGLHLYHFSGGPRVATADCGLVYLAAGTPFPAHRHIGREWNLVLAGALDDSGGDCWLPGDLVIKEPDSVHHYRAQEGEPLILAVVLEAGIEILIGAPPEPAR
jgi:putative transcriptional regulator